MSKNKHSLPTHAERQAVVVELCCTLLRDRAYRWDNSGEEIDHWAGRLGRVVSRALDILAQSECGRPSNKAVVQAIATVFDKRLPLREQQLGKFIKGHATGNLDWAFATGQILALLLDGEDALKNGVYSPETKRLLKFFFGSERPKKGRPAIFEKGPRWRYPAHFVLDEFVADLRWLADCCQFQGSLDDWQIVFSSGEAQFPHAAFPTIKTALAELLQSGARVLFQFKPDTPAAASFNDLHAALAGETWFETHAAQFVGDASGGSAWLHPVLQHVYFGQSYRDITPALLQFTNVPEDGAAPVPFTTRLSDSDADGFPKSLPGAPATGSGDPPPSGGVRDTGS